MFVHTCFYDLMGTFPGINTDLVGTNGPHGGQRPVVMRESVISEVLVGVGAIV